LQVRALPGVGRLIDTLKKLNILDDTLIYYIIGDNGASAEGTLNGTFFPHMRACACGKKNGFALAFSFKEFCDSAAHPGDQSQAIRAKSTSAGKRQNPKSLNPGTSSGRRSRGQKYLRSVSLIGRSFMQARRRAIKPSSRNSQFSFP
jgi:arylsulfatase A-like enzyme